MCPICKKAEKAPKSSFCHECRKRYEAEYREYLRTHPDAPQNKIPCSKCRVRPRRPGQRYCPECERAYRRIAKPIQRKFMSLEARMKERVRKQTRQMILSGLIPRQPCACGETEGVEAHHIDYKRPNLLKWLCRECHRKEHDYHI